MKDSIPHTAGVWTKRPFSLKSTHSFNDARISLTYNAFFAFQFCYLSVYKQLQMINEIRLCLYMQICDCQVHFANYEDGEKKQLPIFGGQKGPEIVRNLGEIESTFNRYLLDLRKVKKTILNVKATSWHENYNKFRSAVKEMEVMVINVINATFETVTYVEQGVEILDAFMQFSTREVTLAAFFFILTVKCRCKRMQHTRLFCSCFVSFRFVGGSSHNRQKDGRGLPAIHRGPEHGEARDHLASCHTRPHASVLCGRGHVGQRPATPHREANAHAEYGSLLAVGRHWRRVAHTIQADHSRSRRIHAQMLQRVGFQSRKRNKRNHKVRNLFFVFVLIHCCSFGRIR